ncbi:MAG: ABC transporter permease [Caldilineaceae bacterium]|nr:ABC transporter permease [Caldilineaceae bacterium]
MSNYLIRRILTAIPTLLFISFIIFALLDLAPGDPTGNLPLTVPPEVREKIRESLGLDEPFAVRYLLWLKQFTLNEPINAIEQSFGVTVPALQIGSISLIDAPEDRLRVTSWAARGKPVTELILERLPQTLWVVGLSYVLSVLMAVPLGVIGAVRQNSFFDQVSSIIAVVGFSIPTFVTGLLAIVIFSVKLGWFPMIYDTTLVVKDFGTFWQQVKQMIMPVAVLAFFQVAQLSRFTRSSMLDNLKQDYVRTANAKGFRERYVVLQHVLRNSLIPVVTLVALGIPSIFAGAIITEQIFRVNGLGALLIISIQSFDIPVVMTVLFIFAVLIVGFNLIADIIYGFLDPRIQYN